MVLYAFRYNCIYCDDMLFVVCCLTMYKCCTSY